MSSKVKMDGTGPNTASRETTGKHGKNGPWTLDSTWPCSHWANNLEQNSTSLRPPNTSRRTSKATLMATTTFWWGGLTLPRTTTHQFWIQILSWLCSVTWKESGSSQLTRSWLNLWTRSWVWRIERCLRLLFWWPKGTWRLETWWLLWKGTSGFIVTGHPLCAHHLWPPCTKPVAWFLTPSRPPKWPLETYTQWTFTTSTSKCPPSAKLMTPHCLTARSWEVTWWSCQAMPVLSPTHTWLKDVPPWLLISGGLMGADCLRRWLFSFICLFWGFW